MRIINTYREPVPPDNPMTTEEIVDICCVEVPFDVCSKAGRVSDYNGAEKEDWNFDPDEELAKAQADNPKIISISTEGIGNRPGEPCGKKYETWKEKNNCCDFIEPLAWDYDNSAEVVVPGSMALVRVLGGAAPYRVSVRGEGFTLDGYRQRDGVYATPFFWVFAEDFACGWCPITVNDGCSIVVHGIRSTLGQWVEIVGAAPCQYPGRGTINHAQTPEVITGQYKVSQICSGDYINCTYDWLPPCTESQVTSAAAWVCAYMQSEQFPCFNVDPDAHQCADGKTYWKYNGLRSILAYRFSGYKAWRWQC